MPAFHTISFGCRASQADGSALEEELLQRGFSRADAYSGADIVVLNTCTVTASADAEARQIARRIHRENPQARILVTGCYAQRDPQQAASLPGVRWVVGNSHKSQIGALLAETPPRLAGSSGFIPLEKITHPGDVATHATDHDQRALGEVASAAAPGAAPGEVQIFSGNILEQRQFAAAPFFGLTAAERTRPSLKIQDGCNSRCSFCVIPQVRGPSRSLPLAEVLEQVRSLLRAGYREVVLSGINLGRYGRDLSGQMRFPQLLRAILNDTSLERLRLSSVEPMDFTDPLLDLMASTPRIAPHVHAPLQSGSLRVLRLMRRKYRPEHYRGRLLAAYQRMPRAAFGADVMVGFPGETEADFEQTRRLIESLPFTYLHVFPFSRRPNTPADSLPQQVHGAVIRERGRILRELAAEKNRRFRERQIGRVLSVLTLDQEEGGGTMALSDNYLKVRIAGERLPANQFVAVRITSLSDSGLAGEP